MDSVDGLCGWTVGWIVWMQLHMDGMDEWTDGEDVRIERIFAWNECMATCKFMKLANFLER